MAAALLPPAVFFAHVVGGIVIAALVFVCWRLLSARRERRELSPAGRALVDLAITLIAIVSVGIGLLLSPGVAVAAASVATATLTYLIIDAWAV